jgi:hypothetical protein
MHGTINIKPKLLKAADVGRKRFRISLIESGSHYVETAGLALGLQNETDRPAQLVQRAQRHVQQTKRNVELNAATATLSAVKINTDTVL